MSVFRVGEIVLRERISSEKWVFSISDVFHLSEEEYARNEEYNDTLGNYDPENELPTQSIATIVATSENGEIVEFKWFSDIKRISPHISKSGWSKALFVKLNVALNKWSFENA